MTHGRDTVSGRSDMSIDPCLTQGLHTSRLSSTPGTLGFSIGVVLLLDGLPTKPAENEPRLPKAVWLLRRRHYSQILRPTYVA